MKPGTRVRLLRTVASYHQGEMGTVVDLPKSSLNGFDCAVQLDVLALSDPKFSVLCFAADELEVAS